MCSFRLMSFSTLLRAFAMCLCVFFWSNKIEIVWFCCAFKTKSFWNETYWKLILHIKCCKWFQKNFCWFFLSKKFHFTLLWYNGFENTIPKYLVGMKSDTSKADLLIIANNLYRIECIWFIFIWVLDKKQPMLSHCVCVCVGGR